MAASIVESIQKGSVALNEDGTVTIETVTAVTLNRSWLVAYIRSPSNRVDQFLLSYKMDSTTEAHFRVSDWNDSVGIKTVEWQLIQFTVASGVTVQRGSETLSGTLNNVTISAVTLNESHVDINSFNGGSTMGADDWTRAELTSTTNLALNTFDSRTGDIINWQVVGWNGHASVEHVNFIFVAGELTEDVLIATIDHTRTIVIGSCEQDNSTTSEQFIRLHCDAADNLVADRYSTSVNNISITAQVIEFTNPDILVQQLNPVELFTAETSFTNTLSPAVVEAETILLFGTAGYWLWSADDTDDDAGEFAVTAKLISTTQYTTERNESVVDAKSNISIVTFGGVAGAAGHPQFYTRRRK